MDLRTEHTIRLALAVTLIVAGAALIFGQSATVSGRSSTPDDPIGILGARIERGDVKLDYDSARWGYLPSLLKQLDIRLDSQLLVFSKTSFQLTKISPATPRAIFFNDRTAVGSVQAGEVFEFTSLSPSQGLLFYTISTHETETPRFERRGSECLNCHGPANGLVVSSVYPQTDGTPFVTGTFFEGIDQRTPLEKRWGGWYVSGLHGRLEHLGNALAPDPDRPFDLDSRNSQNIMDLSLKFDTTKYLTPTSDIVALMTLEHQARMTNLINALSRQFRSAEAGGVPFVSGGPLDKAVEAMVDYMLFVDEAPLDGGVTGVSTFTETFAQRGPRDHAGRSLRDFDLKTRLFRYPLSYMIYSPIFDGMPPAGRAAVYRRLYDTLSGKNPSPGGARISADVRRVILQIVRETKAGLPEYWSESQ